MSETVNLPALGESVTEGTVTRWLKAVGDEVAVDEPLVEVSTDKVDTEIPSPVAGVLEEILVEEDDTVEVGAPLATIGDGSGGGSADASEDDAAAEELLEVPRQDGPVPVLMEATLLALQAGIGRAALTEGTQLLRQRRRTFNTGTAALPKDDPQLLEIMGQLAGRQAAAELMVREIGRLLDEGQDGADGAGPAEADVVAASAEAMAAAYRAQAVVPEAVLEVCTRIFDTLGASATSATLRLDRHWRNARTIATHDPAAFKVRMAGDWLVNGTPPTAYTSAGEAPEGD